MTLRADAVGLVAVSIVNFAFDDRVSDFAVQEPLTAEHAENAEPIRLFSAHSASSA